MDTAEAVVDGYVDVCFDLANLFHQHPEDFLRLPIDDLEFYADSVSRMSKRTRR